VAVVITNLEKTMKRISVKEYHDFRTKYLKSGKQELRFGQAFLNKFFPKVSDPKLFYEINFDKASGYALVNYVKYYIQDDAIIPEEPITPKIPKATKAKKRK